MVSTVESAVVEVLRASAGHARFVPEVAAALRRSRLDADQLESVLVDLEASGRVLVRDHYCADPHAAGTDLRVVALVDETSSPTDDAQAKAIAAIQRVWDQWLSAYFANHRCGA